MAVKYGISVEREVKMKKYIVATAAALIIALAVTVTRVAPVMGGEWLLMIMAPGGVWVWEDVKSE